MPTASAQVTRLANDEPEIRVRGDGRTGVCDVLMFTPDGGTLLAVGEDKVVHRWTIADDALRMTKPLYWNTFREQRGSIYALALSTADPNQTLVAIAGNGKLNSDVAIFDLKTSELLGAVTPLYPTPGEYLRAGGVVWSLAFNAKNSEIAIGDDFGNVWVCPLEAGKPVNARSKRVVTAPPPPAPAVLPKGGVPPVSPAKTLPDEPYHRRVVWVGYTPNGQLAYAQRNGGVFLAGQTEPFIRWDMGAIDKVVASADGLVLAARPAFETKEGTKVEIQPLVGGERKSIPFKHGEFPQRVSLDKTGGRVAVGVSRDLAFGARKPFTFEPPGEIRIYDTQGAAPKLTASKAAEARPDQLAFHPDGKRLATADSLDHGTTLWAINENQLKPINRNVNNGRQLWAVGMTADSRYLCFKERYDPNPLDPNNRADSNDAWKSFDLNGEQRGWGPAGQAPVPAESKRNGWTVRPQSLGEWYVVEPNGNEHFLPLEAMRDYRPQCYTFLPGARANTVRLAVGHAWGASVFELEAGKPPVRVRRLNGHAGYVTAIAPAYDGKGLVTCGHDQAIAIWNLADFPSEPLLGAAFAPNDKGQVFVKSVDPGSPADEAGLSTGDEITAYTRGDSPNPVPLERWFKDFVTPRPALEMLWGIEREGLGKEVDKRAKTALLHRPAAKFVPFANGEWLLYTYRQSYYDRSANGDHYIQWLVSKNRADKQPDVFTVDQFAKFLHKPEKVSEVVTRLQREPAKPLLPDLFPPTVTVKSDIAEVGPGQEVTVTVDVVPSARQDGKVNPVVRVELWLNKHHRVGVDLLAGREFKPGAPINPPVTFKVPASAFRTERNGRNELEARGIGRDDPGTGCGAGVSAPLFVKATAPPQPRRLFVLVAGIEKYEGIAGDLKGARRDALRLTGFLSDLQKTGGYTPDTESKPRMLINQEVTQKNILDQVKAIGKVARADDTFVICLAGHGANFNLDSEDMDKDTNWYYVIPRVDENTPLSGLGKAKETRQQMKNAFLKDEDLADVLVGMDCQPLVLIDCCHSGAAGPKVAARTVRARNTTRDFTKNGFGPVVISSCAENQKAWESVEAFGGGVFSHNILQALDKQKKYAEADENGDGELSVQELFQFVQKGTRRDAGTFDDRGTPAIQEPGISPASEELRDLIILRKPPLEKK